MRAILFIVGRLEFIGSGKFMVGGRNCQDELRRGDRLWLRSAFDSKQIEVIVSEITWYNRNVEEVGSGHTAALLFSNDLAPHFRLNSELHREAA